MFFALMETSRVFGRGCAQVQSQWLYEVAPQLCKSVYDDIHFDERSGFVYARERITAGSLLIHPGRRRNYSAIDPVLAREIFIREGLVEGKVSVPGCRWLEDYNTLLEMLRELEVRMRRPGGMIDEEAIFDHFMQVLPDDLNSGTAAKLHWQRVKRSFTPEPEDIVFYPEVLGNSGDYPDFVQSGGVRLKARYLFDVESSSDGVTLCVKENELNLVNQHILDYGVPGFLRQKIEYLFRALPKTIRRALQPMGENAALFMSLYREGRILKEQPLSGAVRDFVEEYLDLEIPVSILEDVEYPEYLVTKLALVDERGKIRKVLRKFPGRDVIGSRLSHSVQGARRFSLPPGEVWPQNMELPVSAPISMDDERLIYPALVVDKGLVGCSAFLEAREAVLNHRAGILQLFKLGAKIQTDYWRKKIKISNMLKLSLFLNYPEWSSDLLDLAILFALKSDPADIRKPDQFAREMEEALDKIGSEITRIICDLEKFSEAADRIKTLLHRLPGHAWTRVDADNQLTYLFRPGFLRCAEAFGEYSRYLRALQQRLERALGGGGAKDEVKGEPLELFVSRFYLASEKCDISSHAGLLDFFLLLQEARIAVFSPEIRARKGATPAALAEAWDKLRLT